MIIIFICILFTLLDLCVSSLRRGHANLLCIVPMLTDDPRRESSNSYIYVYIYIYVHGEVAHKKTLLQQACDEGFGHPCVRTLDYTYTYIYIYIYIYRWSDTFWVHFVTRF